MKTEHTQSYGKTKSAIRCKCTILSAYIESWETSCQHVIAHVKALEQKEEITQKNKWQETVKLSDEISKIKTSKQMINNQ